MLLLPLIYTCDCWRSTIFPHFIGCFATEGIDQRWMGLSIVHVVALDTVALCPTISFIPSVIKRLGFAHISSLVQSVGSFFGLDEHETCLCLS